MTRNLLNNSSGKYLWPLHHQAIVWTNSDDDTYWQLDLEKQNSVEFKSKCNNFLSRNCIRNVSKISAILLRPFCLKLSCQAENPLCFLLQLNYTSVAVISVWMAKHQIVCIICNVFLQTECSKHLNWLSCCLYPDSKVHGANMGPCRPQTGPMLAPWTLLSGYTKQPCIVYIEISQ